MTVEFTTPVGRLVQGSILKGETHDRKGQPHIIKTGPNKGQPTTKFFFALAFPKTAAAWWQEQPRNEDGSINPFWQQLYQEARTGYSQHFDPQGNCKHPRFAWKVMDGDGVDDNGASNADKQGMAGHWVVKFGGGYAPKLIHDQQYITDVEYPKAGYYYRVAGNAVVNIGSDVPGLYLNPQAVELVAFGQIITGGVNALALFAAAPRAALPAGASLTPPANGPMPMAAAPGLPPPMAGLPPAALPQPYGQPQPAAALPPLPVVPPAASSPVPTSFGNPPAPWYDAAGGPPAYAAPTPSLPPPPNHAFVAALTQPAAPTYQMTAAAGGFTREQYLAQGYSDAILLAQQLMVQA